MDRDTLRVVILWVLLSLAGEWVAWNIDIYPVAAAEEAEHIDAAVRQLIMMAVPVFMFVVVVLAYSVFRFRASQGPQEEGPPLHGHKAFSIGWFVITASLAAALFVTPGYTGLAYLRSNPNEDLVVQVEAAQWHWHITYPQYDLTLKSRPTGFERMEANAVLALPAERRVKFEVTSADVIHSFWIPAFRMKIDAVPGIVTTMYVTPNRVGDFEDDAVFRVQCAELCGTGHPRMNMRVAVMEPAEFEEWVTAQKEGQMKGEMHTEEGGDGHGEEQGH